MGKRAMGRRNSIVEPCILVVYSYYIEANTHTHSRLVLGYND